MLIINYSIFVQIVLIRIFLILKKTPTLSVLLYSVIITVTLTLKIYPGQVSVQAFLKNRLLLKCNGNISMTSAVSFGS